MTTAELVKYEPGQLDLQGKTVEELTAMLNEEHLLLGTAIAEGARRAVRVGAILCVVKQQIPEGSWLSWLRENFDGSEDSARTFMRLARHADLLPEGIGVVEARRWLGTLNLPQVHQKVHPELVAEAQKLARTGKSQRVIGRELGVSQKTVWGMLNLDAERQRKAKYKARRKQEREALRREEEAKAVSLKGGSISHVYSVLRRTLEPALARARDEETNQTAKHQIQVAFEMLNKLEDAVVAVSKNSKLP